MTVPTKTFRIDFSPNLIAPLVFDFHLFSPENLTIGRSGHFLPDVGKPHEPEEML